VIIDVEIKIPQKAGPAVLKCVQLAARMTSHNLELGRDFVLRLKPGVVPQIFEHSVWGFERRTITVQASDVEGCRLAAEPSN